MSGDRALIGLFLMLALCGRSAAESLPVEGAEDPRIRTAAYSGDQVYKLYGFVGYHIDIEFESGESFAGLSAGDPEALIYAAHDHILTIRPRASASHMNLAVSTTKRRYYFDYTIFGREPEPNEAIYAIRFTYPKSLGKDAPPPEERIDLELAQAKSNRARNYDYWFCGAATLKPLAASDDGIHTRLTFPPKAELPALFVRNDDQSESLLNFSMDDGDVVIHRVAPRFVLRRGKLAGCVVNKAFSGSGERVKSGTVATDVIRKRRGQDEQ